MIFAFVLVVLAHSESIFKKINPNECHIVYIPNGYDMTATTPDAAVFTVVISKQSLTCQSTRGEVTYDGLVEYKHNHNQPAHVGFYNKGDSAIYVGIDIDPVYIRSIAIDDAILLMIGFCFCTALLTWLATLVSTQVIDNPLYQQNLCAQPTKVETKHA